MIKRLERFFAALIMTRKDDDMTRKRYIRLLMSFRVQPRAAEALAVRRRTVRKEYSFPYYSPAADGPGWLALAQEFRDIGIAPTITDGLGLAMGLRLYPPSIPQKRRK